MPWRYALLLQAPVAVIDSPDSRNFDLRDHAQAEPDRRLDTRAEQCAPSDDEEIVVCGTRSGPDPRHQRLPDMQTGPPRAETGIIGNVRGKMSVQSMEFPGGVKSNRVMVTITAPF